MKPSDIDTRTPEGRLLLAALKIMGNTWTCKTQEELLQWCEQGAKELFKQMPEVREKDVASCINS